MTKKNYEKYRHSRAYFPLTNIQERIFCHIPLSKVSDSYCTEHNTCHCIDHTEMTGYCSTSYSHFDKYPNNIADVQVHTFSSLHLVSACLESPDLPGATRPLLASFRPNKEEKSQVSPTKRSSTILSSTIPYHLLKMVLAKTRVIRNMPSTQPSKKYPRITSFGIGAISKAKIPIASNASPINAVIFNPLLIFTTLLLISRKATNLSTI